MNKLLRHLLPSAMEGSSLRATLLERLAHGGQGGATVTDEEWNQMEQEISTLYPGFSATLRRLVPGMNSIEYKVCLAVKCQFTPSQTARLIYRSKQDISSIRSRLYEKVFNKKGKPGDFDKFLLSI